MALRWFAVPIACLLAILFTTSAAFAQTAPRDPRDPFKLPPGPKRFDISGAGGFLLSTDWSDLVLLGRVSPTGGALEQVLVRDLVVDPGPVLDGTMTYWEGRYGFRAHTGFSSSCLAVGRSCGDLARLSGSSGNIDVDVWSYDIGGAIGLLDYKRERLAWPYFFFGFGAVTYNLDQTVGPPLTFIERRPTVGNDGVLVRDTSDGLLIATEELGIETVFAINWGVGTDFRVPLGPSSLGIRLEVSDHMHGSPINLDVASLDAFGSDRSVNFGMVHNLRASAGVVFQFGR